MNRTAFIERNTNETQIRLNLALDGRGAYRGESGVPFFDHMLALLCRHGALDIDLAANGDLNVDGHHTIEDIGICLGQALQSALGDKRSIRRYADCAVPMDEALAFAALDISGRPYLYMDIAPKLVSLVGAFDTELVEEFFRALCMNAAITLHLRVPYGVNTHHIIEALFKAFARALRRAVSIDPDERGVPSSKGVL